MVYLEGWPTSNFTSLAQLYRLLNIHKCVNVHFKKVKHPTKSEIAATSRHSSRWPLLFVCKFAYVITDL